MGAESIIATLAARGVKLSVSDGKLDVHLSNPLSDELRDYLKLHKVDLVETIQKNIINTAHQRLSMLAKELDHPLADLLDWYQKPDDMITLGTITMDEARNCAAYYCRDLDLCRYEGYVPIGYVPPTPTANTWVKCMDCQHFTPGTIGAGGIGDCAQDNSPKPPCYPKAQRHCDDYQPITLKEHK